ncbi:MAG: hypothetical protein AAGK21_00130 [Bacteroidota bacterium]
MPSPPAAPRPLCNLVMKGGIASGVVYPRAVVAFAQRYRLRRIGGTSAGAIAAVTAAAAQLGRDRAERGEVASDHRPFAEVGDLPETLGATIRGGWGSRTTLSALFQPTPKARPLMRFARAVMARPSGWGAALALVLAAPLAVAVGVGGGVGLGGWLSGGTTAGLVAGGVVGLVVGLVLAAVSLVRRALRVLPEQGYGMCYGMPGDGPGEALTPWLTSLIDRLAGQAAGDGPLTFRDLWGGDSPGGPEAIELTMITTNLTHGRPYQLPFMRDSDEAFWFSPREMRRYFPSSVVEWLVSHSEDPEKRAPNDEALRVLPEAADLPVVVAARMSLSFPGLIAAVPLYQANRAHPDRTIKGYRNRCWFSDGGLSSNFPIHLFDDPIPLEPTFAMNLRPFPLGRSRSGDERQNVYVPATGRDGRLDAWTPVEGLGGFVGALFRSARNWNDTTMMRLPGYRDRIAHVRVGTDEGGLNLDMPAPVIERLAKRGEAAAQALMAKFEPGQGDDALPGAPEATWGGHRWTRYRTFMTLLERALLALRGGYDAKGTGEASVREMVESLPVERPVYGWARKGQAEYARDRTEELMRVADAMATSEESFEERSPRPLPSLRVRPQL